MRRKLLNVTAAGSLVLCLALGGLWVRSYRNGWSGDRLAFSTGDDHWELGSEGGGVTLYKRDAFPWFFAGAGTGGKIVPRYNRQDVFGINYWIPMAMTTVLPLVWLIKRNRFRRRVAKGLCLHCGYDLRASPGRCPECGSSTDPAGPPAASSAKAVD